MTEATPKPEDNNAPAPKPDDTNAPAPKPEDKKPVDDKNVTPEPKPEDKPEGDPAPKPEDDNKPKDFDREVWGDPGDEIAESVFQVLSDSGVTPTDAKALLFDAVQAGDPSKIDKDALVEKVGKHNANLILAGVNNYISAENARVASAVKAVHDAAGGEQNWKTVIDWVNKNVQDADLNEYRELIDAGGKKASLAVKELVSLYNADPKTTALGKEEVLGDNTPARSQKKGITQREYGDRLDKLHRTGKATPEARAELLALRRAGRAQGL